MNSNSTYYGILGGITAGTDSFKNESSNLIGGQSIRSSSFQTDKVNDQEVTYNFNGLSEWQHFNGVSMNQGCGVVG